MLKRIAGIVGIVLFVTAPWQSASAYSYKVIYSFCAKDGCADGKWPTGRLALDPSGNLYGVTSSGGALGTDGFPRGTVFMLSPKAGDQPWKLKTLHSFCARENCADGEEPEAGLVLDTSGNLYGTAPFGGTFSETGTVFRLSPRQGSHGWKFDVLYAFCRKAGCTDGRSPQQPLTYAGEAAGEPYDGTAPLYGTTLFGGKYHEQHGGTAFVLTHDQSNDKWREDVLYDFCSDKTCKEPLPNPSTGLTIAADGTMYGGVSQDGNPGAVFALSPRQSGGRYQGRTLYSFCALQHCTDGEWPTLDTFALDPQGNLYGTTLNKGKHASGTIFTFDPHTSALTTLYQFCSLAGCADGGGTNAGLLRDPTGALFGVTPRGGDETQSAGTVFAFKGGAYTVLHTFCSEENCRDGYEGGGGLVMDANGTLYGVAVGGGAHDGGVVFALVP